jgi:hypothetical protein
VADIRQELGLQAVGLVELPVQGDQLLRPLRDLLLQSRVRLLEARRHPVELLGKPLKFVACLDRQAEPEVPAPDPLHALSQRLQRRQNAARHQEAREQRHAEADQEERRRPLDRGVEGPEDLLGRPLDEDQPVEAGDRRERAEDALAPGALRERPLRARARRGGGERAADLVEVGNVGPLEHQVDLRVRQEIAGPVHDVDALPVREPGDHVLADVDQAHLGQQDPHDLTREVLDGNGHSHVGLGVPDEVGRTEVGLPAPRRLEGLRRREVALSLGDHRPEARGAGPALAAGVHGDRLGDGGRDEQEALELELIARREPSSRDLAAPRRGGQRAVDLLDELIEPERRVGRGGALDGRDVVLDLVVAEVDLPQAARDQAARQEDERDQEVVPEEAAPPAGGCTLRGRGLGPV